jgi:spore coat protein CotF
MPYGAHETMEVHEILMEKMNVITHFNLYAKETKNQRLLDMIIRHQQEEIRSYDELVNYTHDYNRFAPIPPNTPITGVGPKQIQYGLKNPPQFAPQSDAVLSDWEIAVAMLLCHKNAARNSAWASLECADPNLRRLLLNCAANCGNQAYEVFLFLNEQGLYQVPMLNSHTAKTLLHRYQPTNESLKSQYFGQNAGYGGQNAGYGGQTMGYGGQYGNGNGPYGYSNAVGAETEAMNGALYTGSPESTFYGASSAQGQSSNPSSSGTQNS